MYKKPESDDCKMTLTVTSEGGQEGIQGACESWHVLILDLGRKTSRILCAGEDSILGDAYSQAT